MKNGALILSLYMVLLTLVPCIDSYADFSLDKTELSQQKQDSHHHNDSNCCTPFCACNCCATSIIFEENLVQMNCFSFSNQQYFPLSSDFISDQLASIWQPPKKV